MPADAGIRGRCSRCCSCSGQSDSESVSCARHPTPSSPGRRGPSDCRIFSTVMPANAGIHGRCSRCCPCSGNATAEAFLAPATPHRRPREGGDPATLVLWFPSCPRTRASMDVAFAVALFPTGQQRKRLLRRSPQPSSPRRRGPSDSGLFSTVMPANAGIHGRCLRSCRCFSQKQQPKRFVRCRARGPFLCWPKEKDPKERAFPDGSTARDRTPREDSQTRHPGSTANGGHPWPPPLRGLTIGNGCREMAEPTANSR